MSTRTRRMHPQAQVMLERIAASGEPLLETLPPDQARRVADARVTNSGWPREDLHAVTDRVLAGPGGELRIRVYRPNDRPCAPLILFFHGGGFMVGNLDTHDAVCRVLAARTGAVLLAVDYRLAPEHRFPAAPEDCLFATGWAFAHAAELGVDTNRVAVVGESSGGNLSAVIAQAYAQPDRPRLALQVLIYPSLDMAMDTPSYRDLAEGYFFTRSKSRYFIEHYLSCAADIGDPRASPLRAASFAGLCPALIIAAALDPMVDEAAAYAERLREAAVPVDYYSYEGWPHGFFFWAHTDAAQLAMNSTVDALRKAFE